MASREWQLYSVLCFECIFVLCFCLVSFMSIESLSPSVLDSSAAVFLQ